MSFIGMTRACHAWRLHSHMHALMQGSCSSEPSALALGLQGRELALRTPGQCVLVTDKALMTLDQQNLWLDSLYIQYRSFVNTSICCSTHLLHIYGMEAASLWLTSVTLHGELIPFDESLEPSLYHGAIAVVGANLYAEGGYHLSPLRALRHATVNEIFNSSKNTDACTLSWTSAQGVGTPEGWHYIALPIG
jgi:hypothetical protein